MQYQIVSKGSGDQKVTLADLEEEVASLIRHGWKPQGGVSIVCTYYDWWFATQAMVKED